MRPIELKLCAFGSYGQAQTIDFSKPQQNLFLVTGDTGAGKTTVFDAIVYALYGEASSITNKKDGIELYSQFAAPGTAPYVELKFQEGNDEYLVRREPRHFRRKKNGDLKATAETEKVSLIMPDGEVYPTKETDAKLIEIVGLTKEQFMQVAMIAQGEFMQVLRDSSNNKKVIFRKLFNTEIFEKITTELDTRRKSKGKDIEKIITQCQSIAGSVKIPEDYSAYVELSQLKDELISGKADFIVTMEKFLQGLEVLCEELAEQTAQIGKSCEESDNKYVEISNEYATAQALIRQFETLEKAQHALKECEAKEEEIKNLEIKIQEIRKAYDIKVEYDKYDKSAMDLLKEKELLQNNQNVLPELKDIFSKKSEKLTELQATKEKSDSQFVQTQERVNKALLQFSVIEELTQAVKNEKEKRDAANEKKNHIIQEIEDFTKQVNDWKLQENELQGADVRFTEVQNKKTKIEEVNARLDKAKSDYKEIEGQKSALEKAQKDLIGQEKECEKINEDYNKKFRLYISAQAGFLAKELAEDKPCPVCGSLSHPNPCVLAEEMGEISRESIDKLKKDVDNCQEKVLKCSKEVGELNIKVKERQEVLASKLEEIKVVLENEFENKFENKPAGKLENEFENKPADKEMIKYLLAVADALSQKINEEYYKASVDDRNLQILREKLTGAESKKLQFEAQKEEAEKLFNKAELSYNSKSTALKTNSENLDFASRDEAEKILLAATVLKKDNDRNFAEAKLKNDNAKSEMEQCQTRIKESEDRIPQLEENVVLTEKTYQEIMSKKDMSEEQWKKTVMNNGKDVSEYEGIVSAFKETRNNALTSQKQAMEFIEGKEKPDLEEIQVRLKDAEHEKIRVYQRRDEIREYSNTAESVKKQLLPTMENRKTVIAQKDRLDKVYNCLAGKISGARMDIETFAQRYYLERILEAANNRFMNMSRGQFELRMHSVDKAGAGGNKGLDLLVYSTVNAQEREINTLSGGESFMAALALALGMSDVIQAKSAAVNLDIMFIDEGFGSLDDHSRNEAIKVLKKMAGGSKLIGIISHVTELKQEIDDLLYVTKDDKGSRAEWK